LKFENHQYYNCEVTLSTGEKCLIAANWIHNNHLNHWQGWNCDVGLHRINVDKNFDVWSGECQNDYLGNLKTEWAPLAEPTTCKQQRCTGCTDDLLMSKHAPLGVKNA
jgi:hypothetical protein